MTRVLFVTRNFPPLVGGMERLALEAVQALAAGSEVSLLGPKGCEPWAPGPVTAVAHHAAGRFLLESGLTARRLAGRGAPDRVIGGSGLAAPAVLAAARAAGARSACFVHGLDLVVASRIYRTLCLPALRRMDLVIANSRNTAGLAVAAGIRPDHIEVLHPGVAIGEGAGPERFLSQFPVSAGRPLLLSVGRLLPRKGVADFVRRVLSQLVARHPDVLLVVAGGAADNALKRGGDEGGRLVDAVEQSGMQNHVLITGELSNELLQSLYGSASLMVFPVKDLPGDVEGFGMVALEAAAHGLPTVAFAAGGVPDAVSDGVSGSLIPAGDFDRMATRISDYLAGEWGTVTAGSCRAFAAAFAWPQYGERLRALILGEKVGQG